MAPGVALDSTQLQNSADFAGFDFARNLDDGLEDTWTIVSGHCPRLSWQTDDGPLPPVLPSTSLTGAGTLADPFAIEDVTDFLEFCTNEQLVYGNYCLYADLDLASSPFTGVAVNRHFGGDFLGNGHVVRNLTIDARCPVDQNLALFPSVCGTIRGLGLENVQITGAMQPLALGGLCGSNFGTLSQCFVTGYVTGNYSLIGGLCGKNEYGMISDCYSTVSVVLTGDPHYRHVGGLCGRADQGTVARSYSTGAVTGAGDTDVVGALCGWNHGTISDCFWDAEASGMLIGIGSDRGTVTGTTGKTTSQMQAQSTFTAAGWDFVGETAVGTDDAWYMAGYPALTCLSPAPIQALTVINGAGGGFYPAGTTVTVTADAAPEGQAFADWTADPAEFAANLVVASSSPTTFTMPAGDATLTATYAPKTYSITFELGEHGTRAGGGELIQTVVYGTAAVAPTLATDPGWTFAQWDVSFASVAGDLTVTALYEALPRYAVTLHRARPGSHCGRVRAGCVPRQRCHAGLGCSRGRLLLGRMVRERSANLHRPGVVSLGPDRGSRADRCLRPVGTSR